MSSSRNHFSCKPCAEFEAYSKIIDSNGLYVSDLHPQATEDELYNVFNNFGQVADFYMPENGSYCLVHYTDRRAADEMLTYPTGIFGRQFRVRPRFPSKADEEKRAELNEVHKSHEQLLKSISEKSNFMEQVSSFLKASEAGETEIQNQYEVCRFIEDALKRLSSDYKVLPFGSSVTGLAFKHSDLDLFYGKEAHCTAPNITDVFQRVRRCLEKLNVSLESLRAIPNARVPIIKFVHKSTGLSCDLSFRNSMGVQNSRLIKFLISLDSRIKPFFMIVKYWAKLHRLTGRRLSNYALIMLMISFLQSLNDPILPPLYILQDEAVEKWVAGWNAGFDDDPTKLTPISNNLSLEELLTQFFDSVVRTDFENHVLCPYLGCFLPKELFYNMSKLPRRLDLYVRNVRAGKNPLKAGLSICLQDPIELNLNITQNVAKHDFKCLRDHCAIAAQLSIASPPHLFLSKLLSTSYDYLSSSHKRTWLPNPLHVCSVRPFMTLHIPYPEYVTDNITWTCEFTKKIILIFKKVLKVHVEDVKKGEDRKPGSDQDLLCKGSQVLWVNRDKLSNLWSSAKQAHPRNRANSNDEIVEVLDDSEPSGSMQSGGQGRKRKRDIEQNCANKRREIETVCLQDESSSSDVEITVIDLDQSTTNTSAPRSVEEEINLTNEMVKRGHAKPAAQWILDFYCKICRDVNNVRIELSDRRSKNNYFSSLCAFLEEFLSRHVTRSEATTSK
ncbi:hypothetical protein ONE63_002681 [Megalurothrips usitatus]|uniref:RRM domain-containing protein n=1 Tax=Megalurothrips usitatus TaxID=439358 RepID=A0AAV7XBY4_9NEOP|nr:hypothetical protein ONE63_002681 [Megalurothrips usitatus]